MKKFIFTTLLCFSALVSAEQTQPECGEIKEVLSLLLTKYGEKPIWAGKTERGLSYGILANPTEKNWTLIQFDGKFACILLTGDNYSAANIGPKSKFSIKIKE